eukprot:1477269-Amphidinium_carterae.1
MHLCIDSRKHTHNCKLSSCGCGCGGVCGCGACGCGACASGSSACCGRCGCRGGGCRGGGWSGGLGRRPCKHSLKRTQPIKTVFVVTKLIQSDLLSCHRSLPIP